MIDNKCVFNQIYKFDADHVIDGVSIQDIRRELSIQVAQHLRVCGKTYDVVSGIPNTGYFYAEHVAEYLNCDFARIFEKKLHKRTLGTASQKRVSIYDSLLMSLDSVDKDAKILFVDEALLSGLTLKIIAGACQEIGFERYSFAFMSPITLCHCPWGHIKQTDRWFHKLNWNPTQDCEEDLRRTLLEWTGAEDIIYCPPEVFSRVIDFRTNCSLCFYDGSVTTGGHPGPQRAA